MEKTGKTEREFGLRPEAKALSRQLKSAELRWAKLPVEWGEAPFLGNGLLGAMLFQTAAHVLSLQIHRADVFDQRDPGESWDHKNRPRLPIGSFTFELNRPIEKGSLRLAIADAMLHFTLKTDKGVVKGRVFIPLQTDVFALEFSCSGEAKVNYFRFRPGFATPPPNVFNSMKNRESYKLNPSPEFAKAEDLELCVQRLLTGGGFSVAWTPLKDGKTQKIFFGIGYANDWKDAKKEAVCAVESARKTSFEKLRKEHAARWKAYYEASSFSIPDKKLEAFCAQQLYKFGCSSRVGGPVIDVAGPWYQPQSWAGLWWNMNAEVAYWIANPSNHPELNEPLLRSFETFEENLKLNVPPEFRGDSIGLGRASAPDLRADAGTELSNLPWILQNCHMQFLCTQDETLLKRLYPLLKKSARLLLHHLEKERRADGSTVLHLKPLMQGEEPELVKDSIQLLTLLRWELETLLDSAKRLGVAEPDEAEWRDTLEKLAPLPTDSKIGFLKPTPCYSPANYMTSVYPIHLVSIHDKKWRKTIELSLDHWLKNALKLPNWDREGHGLRYTYGAACMASAGRGETAWKLLRLFIDTRVTFSTMYREGDNPTLETSMSACAALYEMLFQSFGGVLRIFPAIPESWRSCSFRSLRGEGAFLVSAERKNGKTAWVSIKSEKGGAVELVSGMKRPKMSAASTGVEKLSEEKGRMKLSFKPGGMAFFEAN